MRKEYPPPMHQWGLFFASRSPCFVGVFWVANRIGENKSTVLVDGGCTGLIFGVSQDSDPQRRKPTPMNTATNNTAATLTTLTAEAYGWGFDMYTNIVIPGLAQIGETSVRVECEGEDWVAITELVGEREGETLDACVEAFLDGARAAVESCER